jgi:Zn-dependent peptidase ImmA (M78 family)
VSAPERAAIRVLKRLRISEPPVDVSEVARNLGIRVELVDLGDDCSGMLVRGKDGAVIGVNYGHHPNRQRFTIAHEIGHFELHEGGTYVDRGTTFRLRSTEMNSGSAVEEREANQFAAALLMPSAWVRHELRGEALELGDDEALRELCSRFGVSTQAMLYRLVNLRVFEDSAGSPST